MISQKKLSLVFYSPQFFPSFGGLQNVVHYWASGLSNLAFQITVITHTAATQPDNYAYTVMRNVGRKKELILMRGCDAVIMFNVSLKALPQWLLSRKPLLVSHHSAFRYDNQPAKWPQRIKRWVANRLAIGNVACSQFTANDYRNCAVIHSPYDNGVYFNSQQPRTPKSFVFAGRLVTDKGVDTLLQAFALLPDDCTLTIIGDGAERDALEKLANSLKIQGRVQFTGALQSVAVSLQLNSHQVMVVPSRLEPFGIVVLEGLACGCRMVLSWQGGLPEAADGLAWLFEPDDVHQLSKALKTALVSSDFDSLMVRKHLDANNIAATSNQLAAWVLQKVNGGSR